MSQRRDLGTLADRAAASSPSDPIRPVIRHCWVLDPHGSRQPGLLLEWERRAGGWFGRVVHLEGRDVVEDWLPADRLEPP